MAVVQARECFDCFLITPGLTTVDSESISRRYSYPLRSGHKVAYLCTETATYRYLYSADAAKRWFVNNVDAVVRAYGRDHHIGKEDLFFGTLYTRTS